jgi:hypothetical protein
MIVAFFKGGSRNYISRPASTIIIKKVSAPTPMPKPQPKNINRPRPTAKNVNTPAPTPTPTPEITENDSSPIPSPASSPIPDNTALNTTTTAANSNVEIAENSWTPGWLNTTDIAALFMQAYQPQISLESIRPFSEVNENGELWFWQGRYAYRNGSGTTANFGVGWRKLSTDKSEAFGLNSFYDYAFEHGYSRIGMGAEYFEKLSEYRVNFYFPLTGEKSINESSSSSSINISSISSSSNSSTPNTEQTSVERAVQGFDFEIGHTFEQQLWLSFYLTGFHYNNEYSDDSAGYKIRTNMQLTPRFALELGYIDTGRDNGNFYGKLSYTFLDVFGPALFGTHRLQDFNSGDLSYKLYQKVYRANDIRTETKSLSSPQIQTGGAIITVYADDGLNGTHLAGTDGYPSQTVSVSVNGVTQTATTDTSGQATFSNLPAGSYTFSIGVQSVTLTVKARETVTGTITIMW